MTNKQKKREEGQESQIYFWKSSRVPNGLEHFGSIFLFWSRIYWPKMQTLAFVISSFDISVFFSTTETENKNKTWEKREEKEN